MNLKEAMDRFYVGMVVHELSCSDFTRFASLRRNSLLYLDLIAYQENCTVSYLADTLHIAKSAVTLKVKELEKKGLLTKTQSSEDGRVFYLHVEKEILREYRAYDRDLEGALSTLAERYSAEQIALFSAMLSTIGDTLGQNDKGDKK